MARYPIWDDSWIQQLTDDDARTLLAIFEAMRRVDQGTYGLCVRCGSAVDIERLRALPESSVCEVCAAFSEVTSYAAAM